MPIVEAARLLLSRYMYWGEGSALNRGLTFTFLEFVRGYTTPYHDGLQSRELGRKCSCQQPPRHGYAQLSWVINGWWHRFGFGVTSCHLWLLGDHRRHTEITLGEQKSKQTEFEQLRLNNAQLHWCRKKWCIQHWVLKLEEGFLLT